MIGSTRREYPNDTDGDVLQRLHDSGFDFASRHDVDFYCYASDYAKAEKICVVASKQGYECDISVDEEASDPLTKYSVYMTSKIFVTYDEVMERQVSLNKLLFDFNTKYDGWGVMLNA